MRKIVAISTHSPLPDRQHDWCAHYDGEEEAGNYGYGETEAEAIADFIDNCQADHDERLSAFDRLGRVASTCLETAYGKTCRLSFQVKVF